MPRSSLIKADYDILGPYFAEMARIPVLTADQEAQALRAIEDAEARVLAEALRSRQFDRLMRHQLVKSMVEEDLPTGDVAASQRTDPRAFLRLVKFHEPGRRWMEDVLDKASRQSHMVRFGVTPSVARKRCADVRRRRAALLAQKNRFASANLRLVVVIAKRYARPGMNGGLPDLIQEGNMGLMKAIDRFDVDRGYKFSTYGLWWIRHHIKRAIEEKESAVRVPVHMMDTIFKVGRAEAAHKSRTGEDLEPDGIARATGLDESKVRRAIAQRSISIISLNSPAPSVPDAETSLMDYVPASGPDADDELNKVRLRREVLRLLTALTPFESQIVRWRLGLDGEEELTLREIAEKYDLSRERIRQIQEKAFDKMRRRGTLEQFR